MADGVGHVGAVLRSETDAKIAAVNARLDNIEAMVVEKDRLMHLRKHEVYKLVCEMETAGAEEEESIKRQWASDHSVTMKETNKLLEEFKRA